MNVFIAAFPPLGILFPMRAVPCRNGLADSRSTGKVQKPLNSFDQCFSMVPFSYILLPTIFPTSNFLIVSVLDPLCSVCSEKWRKRMEKVQACLKLIFSLPADIWKPFLAHNGGRRSRETHYKKALRPLQEAAQPKRNGDCSQASTDQSKELVAAQKSAIKLLEVNSNQKGGLGTEEVEKHAKRLRTKVGVQAASSISFPMHLSTFWLWCDQVVLITTF